MPQNLHDVELPHPLLENHCGSFTRNNFLKLNKSIFLREEMFFIHYLLQIKQSIYSVGIFHVPVVS